MIANLSWQFVDRGLRLIANFGFAALFAWALGPSAFGELNLLLIAMVSLAPFYWLGSDELINAEFHRRPEESPERILGAIMGARLVAALGAIGLYVLAVLLLMPAVDHSVLLYAVALLFLPAATLGAYFNRLGRSKWIACATLIAFGTGALLKTWVLLTGPDLTRILMCYAIEVMAFAFCLLVIARCWAGLTFVAIRIPAALVREYGRRALPLFAAGILTSVYMRIDHFLIAGLLSPDELGQYSLAARLAELWHTVLVVVFVALSPQLIARSNLDDAAHRGFLLRIGAWQVLTTLATLAAAISLGPWLIPVIFGADYRPAIPPFFLLLAAALPIGLGLLSTPWLVARNLNTIIIARTVAGAGCGIGINLLLIPRFGIIGAGCAALITQVVACLVVEALFPASRAMFRLKLTAIGHALTLRCLRRPA